MVRVGGQERSQTERPANLRLEQCRFHPLGCDYDLSSGALRVTWAAVKQKRNIWLPAVLLLVFAVSRWPGLLPSNFSAAYALAFCAGVYFPGRLAWWVPMSVLLTTDLLLNLYYGAPLINGYMALNYTAYAVLIGLGRRFSAKTSWLKLLAGGIVGAILFYLITNTAAWFNPAPGPYPQEPYPKTILGWIQALTIGSPPWPPTWTFFRNTLMSGGLFTGLFVAAMKFSEGTKRSEKEEPEEEEEHAPDAEPEKAEA